MVFSEPIDLSTLTPEDLTLLRDGVIVPLDASVTVSQVGGEHVPHRRIEEFHSAPGEYQLIVDAAGITDVAGNAGVGTASDSWTWSPPIGEIHGTVWNDYNGDGVRDPGEPGMPGMTVFWTPTTTASPTPGKRPR